MLRTLLSMAVAAGLAIAQTPAPPASENNPPLGSITGTVRDTEGAPVPDADVRVYANGESVDASTDAAGRYEIRDVPAGTHRMTASLDFRSQGRFALTRRTVTLAPGQEVRAIDFQIDGPPPEITGRVLDQNGEIMPGVSVHLVATEYQLGALRNGFRELATTDDQGVYRLWRTLKPGVAYAVLARARPWDLPAISDAPTDPELRRPVRAPTYYPKSPSIDGAERLILRGGEVREGVDIQVSYAPSYCLGGVLSANGLPAESHFQIEEREATFGTYSGGGFYGRTPSGTTGPDGRIRICDLQPGNYRITASSPFATTGPFFFSTADVTIDRSDIRNFTLTALPVVPLRGEVVWDLAPPKELEERPVRVSLHSLFRAVWPPERRGLNAGTTVPGEISFPSLLFDDYQVRVSGLPGGVYVKDITFGGASILHRPLRVGTVVGGDALLRIVLAHDAAVLKAKIRDEDDEPIGNAHVYLIPESARTQADFADQGISGLTDQYGAYTSGALPPGKYTVVAATVALSPAPEDAAKLWRAGPKAKEVELAPDATTEVTVEVVDLR